MAPFLLVILIRFKKEVKNAIRELGKDQASMIALLQNGLESMRTVSAFGRHELEEDHLQQISTETIRAALRVRKIKSFISPVFVLSVSL